MTNKGILWREIIGYLLDLYIGALFATLPISIYTYCETGIMSQDITQFTNVQQIILLISKIMILVIYYILMPIKITKFSTIGERIMGLQIDSPCISKFILRQLIFIIFMASGAGVICEIFKAVTAIDIAGYINMFVSYASLASMGFLLFTKQHCMLHDRLFSTRVIQKTQEKKEGVQVYD